MGLEQGPLGVEQPPSDARKQRPEILVLHHTANYTRRQIIGVRV
jgi:hypothetical protein